MSSSALGDVRIDDLRALLVVERTASLAAAARQLRSSPSRVSKIVARLEKRLGQALLTRTSRGVGLTEGGQRLLPGIAGLVAQFDTLLAREKAPTLDLPSQPSRTWSRCVSRRSPRLFLGFGCAA